MPIDEDTKLPCAVSCDRGPTFCKGVSLGALLGYLERRAKYDAEEPQLEHTCGLPWGSWSETGPSADCPLCRARVGFHSLRRGIVGPTI